MPKLSDKLKAAFDGLEKKLQRKVLRDAVRAGAKVIADEIVQRAPKDTGDMADHVRVRAGKRKRGRISARVVVPGSHGRASVAALEYGRHGQQATPFILPSFDAKKEEAVKVVGEVVAEGIRRLAK